MQLFSYLQNQNMTLINNYFDDLKISAALTLLASKSLDTPYLYYREVENIFCQSFNAIDVSREDISVDAHLNQIGIGIKTFLSSGASSQKIAEFNKQSEQYRKLDAKDLALSISQLRNQRISDTMSKLNLYTMIYHCVTRTKNQLVIYEEIMHLININNISNINENKGIISFTDGTSSYSFNRSKSTLYKKFITPDNALIIPVTFIDNPRKLLRETFQSYNIVTPHNAVIPEELKIKEANQYIILPLYAPSSHEDTRKVGPKSGLNQWAASGRPRDLNEVYIPIPAWIHKKFPDFFPPNNIPFNLKIPNLSTISAKVCQQGGKALMSNPNSELGSWILRDILKLTEGTPVTYEILSAIGIDSIKIEKTHENKYYIDFMRIGAYERFEIHNNI